MLVNKKLFRLNQSGLAHLLYPILGVAVIAVIAGAGFYVYQQNDSGAGHDGPGITKTKTVFLTVRAFVPNCDIIMDARASGGFLPNSENVDRTYEHNSIGRTAACKKFKKGPFAGQYSTSYKFKFTGVNKSFRSFQYKAWTKEQYEISLLSSLDEIRLGVYISPDGAINSRLLSSVYSYSFKVKLQRK